MKDSILNNLLRHFAEVKPQINLFSNNELFKDELGVDSLDMAEFIARVEQDYRVEIPDEDWPKIATMNLLVNYIDHAVAN
ncbi:acyl carrier protein [Aggregatimonas sangjinii]|uniref:Acyl carrier protein n=1 Tax=Aggregatimonas sangjinii TaxID=2583587 RepID=A0A5B7SQW8_9FLAO|nr:phosphopantetheine-binding protein [Aggregatimonas sangjinii]QCX01016.1 acyl carrier protein [Aggregatimonas sangjinii]